MNLRHPVQNTCNRRFATRIFQTVLTFHHKVVGLIAGDGQVMIYASACKCTRYWQGPWQIPHVAGANAIPPPRNVALIRVSRR
jgi:hypothetical protein